MKTYAGFEQREYGGIPYNLWIPKTIEEGQRYPLVFFLHDAGTNGEDPTLTLTQGQGATGFTTEAVQKETPCFVLAPQISRSIRLTTDEFTVSKELEILKSMIDDVADKYPIDRGRIYATGQSQGCMASCELNIRYPEFFAASLLVAGQWDPVKMAERCRNQKLWILVSDGDIKAYPGMTAVTDAMEKAGARVGRYIWDARESDETLNRRVSEALEENVNIRFTVFKDHSVVPENVYDDPGNNHVWTWHRVYALEALRKWLVTA